MDNTSIDAKEQCILLLDTYSRTFIKRSLTDLNRSNVSIINSLNELSDDLLEKSRTLIILEYFMREPNARAALKFYKEVLDLTIVYLGAEERWIHLVDDFASVYKCDVASLDYDTIQAALYNDNGFNADLKHIDSFYETTIEVADVILDPTSDATSDSRLVAAEYKNVVAALDYYREKADILAKQNEQLEAQCTELSTINKKYREGYTKMLKDSRRLNKTLRQYEGILSKDLYSKLNLSKYSNKPYVIYLKEYEDLINQNMFISSLFEVFRTQLKCSVKVLQLFDSKTSKRLLTLPSYYTVIYNKYFDKDVIVNDFIAKAGDCTSVLDLLLTNKYNLDILIIVDSKSVLDTVLAGSMLSLNICRSPEHLKAFDIMEDSTIVNAAEDSFYLAFDDYADTLDTFSNQKEKFLYLSSRPIFQHLLSLFDLYKESI